MKTLGIDLSAQAEGTFLCVIDWGAGGATIEALDANREADPDSHLRAAIARDDLAAVGVDVPFGWPDAFVTLMRGEVTVDAWRSTSSVGLRLRETDRQPHMKALRVSPMSVTMDRIAAPAMRWRLLTAQVPAGVGRCHEVYPAAALKHWNAPHRGYKLPEQRDQRVKILRVLEQTLSLQTKRFTRLLLERADALDALVASLVARAVALGHTTKPPPEQAAVAAREGWIHLPTCALAELLNRQPPL